MKNVEMRVDSLKNALYVMQNVQRISDVCWMQGGCPTGSGQARQGPLDATAEEKLPKKDRQFSKELGSGEVGK